MGQLVGAGALKHPLLSYGPDLEDQVAGDLAMLLAERFDQSRHDAAPTAVADIGLVARVPAPYTETIGREGELAELRAMLAGGLTGW